jgi:CTP:molybdopterin cytidylyltransferase MocA
VNDEKAPLRFGAVVLAAGGSARFGSPKQLLVYDGEPLIKRAAIAAREAGAEEVVVVLGADAGEVAPAVSGLARIRTIINARWASGLASSITAGIKALFDETSFDAVLVTLADQPLVDATALRRLLDAFGNDRRIVASAYSGTIGVPALFPAEHLPDLLRLSGDQGAGGWLRDRSTKVTAIPLDAAAVDIDSPLDADRMSQSAYQTRVN